MLLGRFWNRNHLFNERCIWNARHLIESENGLFSWFRLPYQYSEPKRTSYVTYHFSKYHFENRWKLQNQKNVLHCCCTIIISKSITEDKKQEEICKAVWHNADLILFVTLLKNSTLRDSTCFRRLLKLMSHKELKSKGSWCLITCC